MSKLCQIEREINLKIKNLERDFSKGGVGEHFIFAKDVFELIQYTRMIQRHNKLHSKNIVALSTMLAETQLAAQELIGVEV